MVSTGKTLAKVSSPKLSGIVPRKRLFNLLDEALEHPMVWVSAQPGAGKTALVASYLTAKKLPSIWYHVDAGDQDPATLFHYLGLAAASLSKRRRTNIPLPALMPEYLPDLAGFVRRWFRQFFAMLPQHCVVVFDNYQEVNIQAPLHAILRDALEVAPEGINVVVLSRMTAPAEFARLAASRRIGMIEWEDLQLTLDETAKVANIDLAVDEETARTMHSQSNGWAAGVILMLERLRRTGKVNRIDSGDSMETIFNYFAELVFKQATVEDQTALMQIAYLPSMSAEQARTLTGRADVEKLLETLYKRRLFTNRRAGDPITYHFHALFRNFLLARAEAKYSGDEKRGLVQRSAKLLAEAGQIEDAFALYSAAADWSASVQIIVSSAYELVKQGRRDTLQTWIGSVPELERNSSPWLDYWLGICWLAINPRETQPLFERAFHAFQVEGDVVGQALAASGVANSYYFEYCTFRPLDKWIPILETLILGNNKWPTHDIEFQVLSSFVVLLAYSQPKHPLLNICGVRLMTLMQEDIDPGMKIAAGTYLLHAKSWDADLAGTLQIRSVVDPISRLPQVPPLYRAWWRIGLMCHGVLCGMPGLSLTAAREAVEIVETFGLGFLRHKVTAYYLYSLLAANEVALAKKVFADLVPMEHSPHQVDAGIFLFLKSWLFLVDDNLAEARVTVEKCLGLFESSAIPNFFLHGLICKAMTLTSLSEYELALSCVKQARENNTGANTRLFLFTYNLIEADIAFKMDHEVRGIELLSEAMALGKLHKLISNAQWIVAMMTRLCGRALRNGIEVDYVTQLIKERNLPPPSDDADNWPWPVKISTLGSFEILRDDSPIASGRKAQRKVEDLLRLLIALGGKDVQSAQLIEALWPELDGDAAQNNLKGSVHRLRKLLGDDEAILVQDSKLSLNPKLCWVDCYAVENLMDRMVDNSFENGDALGNAARQLLQCYWGHFLAEETTLPAVITFRDKLRSKFRRSVLKLGKQLEISEQSESAAELYQRALELDNLSEEIYQRLITCYKQTGNEAEALNVYRRCRDMLSIVLGVTPSKETQALLA